LLALTLWAKARGARVTEVKEPRPSLFRESRRRFRLLSVAAKRQEPMESCREKIAKEHPLTPAIPFARIFLVESVHSWGFIGTHEDLLHMPKHLSGRFYPLSARRRSSCRASHGNRSAACRRT